MVQSGSIQQMREALVRQGVQVAGLTNEQIVELCSKKLQESLTGGNAGSTTDDYIKNLKYNLKFPLPDGGTVNVAKIAQTTLKSGRKIETFIDIAGNQYFQYRSSDETIIKENHFKQQEKLKGLYKVVYMDGKLYKQNIMSGALNELGKTEQSGTLIKKDEQDNRTYAEKVVDTLKGSVSGEAEKLLYKKVRAALDTNNYAGAVATFGDYLCAGAKDVYNCSENILKSAIYDGLMKLGPEQLGQFLDDIIDDGNDNNVTVLEKYTGIAGSASKRFIDIVTTPEMVVTPGAIASLPAKAVSWVTNLIVSGATAYGITELPGAVRSAYSAKTPDEIKESGEHLGDVGFALTAAAGLTKFTKNRIKAEVPANDLNKHLIAQIKNIKGPDGNPLFSKDDIEKIPYVIEYCSYYKNYSQRLLAVLQNQKEIERIANSSNRIFELSKAFIDPLPQTKKQFPKSCSGRLVIANKPIIPKSPTVKLPKILTGNEPPNVIAQTYRFGNGTLNDIGDPTFVGIMAKKFSIHFGKNIKPEDLQVIVGNNGTFISYFDPKTKLITTTTYSGDFNTQYSFTFDNQGNLEGLYLENFYFIDKFVPR